MIRYCCVAWTVSAALLISGSARGQGIDHVRKKNGTVSGAVAQVDALKVVVRKRGRETVEIPVHEITSIAYAGEPRELTQARVHLSGRRYAETLKELDAVDTDQLSRQEVKDDVRFYQALCRAKLALAGEGSMPDAGRALYEFVMNSQTSYHYLEACEVLADLLAALGKYDRAGDFYDRLAQSPAAVHQMRSALRSGQMLRLQKKLPAAVAKLDQVLSVSADTAEQKHYHAEATLEKALCQADDGQVGQAVANIRDVIAKTPNEDFRILALAYNALGNCYEKDGRTKDALLAFLHVDLLYPSQSEAHAESLSRLAVLWKAVGKEDRARDARNLLEERYPGTRWTR